MKKTFKTIISVVLAVIMILSVMITPMAASDGEVSLEISNESKFDWGDTISFNITITNNTDSRITNVDLVSEAKGLSKYFDETADSAGVIEYITPGATRTVEIKYATEYISGFSSFFRGISTFFGQLFARFSRSYAYTEKIKVGFSNVTFGIDVDYEVAPPTISGDVNLDDPEPDVEIYSFEADTSDILVNEETTVIFTSEIFSNIELDEDDVKVVDDDNNFISYMNDDGVYPDECEDDGIYTAIATLGSTERNLINYVAKYDNIISECFEICFYTPITAEDYNDFISVMDDVDTFSNKDDVKDYLSNSTEIESVSVDDETGIITFVSDSGITGVWDENIGNGTTKGSKAEKTQKNDVQINYSFANGTRNSDEYYVSATNKNVAVIRPYIGSDPNFTNSSRTTGRMIADALGGSCTVVDDGNVTLEFMKSLDDYGTVIMDSHGTRADVTNSAWSVFAGDPYMIIGETLDSRFDTFFDGDWQSSRIIVLSGSRRIAVGGKFFSKYYADNSLDDAVFFLGTCWSMYNDTISSALLSKGVASVFGFSLPVTFGYCDMTWESVFDYMVNSYQTTSEAYNSTGNSIGFIDIYGDARFMHSSSKSYSYFERDAGTVAGVIKNASTGSAVNNALIRIYKDGDLVASTRTSSNGSYNVSVPAGDYILKVSAGGYKAAKMAVTVRSNATTYNETFLLISNGLSTGYANGNTINAITGQLLPNVRINIRKSWNNQQGQIVQTITSNENGYYEVSLPAGLYTFECYKDGYITTYKNVLVFVYDYASQDISVAPELGEGYYRVVLTWGENPHDLDSHLFGYADDYSYRVYYGDMNGYTSNGELVANLDVDDVSSYGPETTTFYVDSNANYEFYVDWFSGDGTWASSGGKVEVYNGAYLINTYYVPSVDNQYGSWKVFSLEDGVYKSHNIIQSTDIY